MSIEQTTSRPPSQRRATREYKKLLESAKTDTENLLKNLPVKNDQINTIMDAQNKNLKIGNAKKIEPYIK